MGRGVKATQVQAVDIALFDADSNEIEPALAV